MSASLKSPLLEKIPGIVHGFGTKAESVPAPFQGDWDTHRPKWQQVHKTGVAQVLKPRQECGEVDALYTDRAGLPIAVQTADCVPVLIARRDGGVVAAVHAGWRGTYARILAAVWMELVAHSGARASDYVAAIGPAARWCCYEVGLDLIRDFKAEFPSLAPADYIRGERLIDIQTVNRHQLLELGFESVDVLQICTICGRDDAGDPLFYSHRRKPKEGRQWAAIRKL